MDYKDGALSKKKDGGGEKKESESKSEHKGGGGGKKPHIHIHPHEAGHTMHVMHDDGSHEMHHFAEGDHAAMGDMVAQHMGGGAGEMEPGAAGGAPEPEEQAA